MTNWVDVLNYAVASSGLVVALLGLLFSAATPFIGRWERHWFVSVFALIVAYVSADLVAQSSGLLLGPGYAGLSKASVFCESLFSSLLTPMLTVYLLHCTGETWRTSTVLRAVALLWVAYFGLLVCTQFTGDLYYFTPDNAYHRGALYPLLLVPPSLIMGCNIVALHRRRGALTHRQLVAFATFLGVPLTCMLVQMVSFGLLMIVIGTCVAALVMFVFMFADHVDAVVQERERAALRQAQLMALQMRPHFIYNVMTSIYYLCAQDPARAQQVTLDFTDYLRANFSAVAKTDPIPFAEELDHARAYLAVEQARFEGQLEVEIVCPHTAFRVPPLTLQPLVENAVKHGMDPDGPPLHVRVTSRDEGDHAVVEVVDNGPGFDPDSLSDGSSALDNIRERLAAVGADISFDSHPEAGTRVEIRIPYGEDGS